MEAKAIPDNENVERILQEGWRLFEENGDLVFIPAEVPHWYRNIGQEPFEFLCPVPNKSDTITILR